MSHYTTSPFNYKTILLPPLQFSPPNQLVLKKKRLGVMIMEMENLKATELRLGLPGADEEHERPVSKAQVVGWPPIRAYRKNSFQGRKTETEAVVGGGGIYVKVSMDGAPYLRKIDLKVYKSYEELREALEDMFKCFTLGDFSSAAAGGGGANYVVAYEDKDGDWMLVGDVPWRMFISSCKRLRIMRGSEAKGLNSST